MTDSTKLKQLQEPFDPDDVEWRVQQCGAKNNRAWALVIPYITNRAIQQRLDEVFGFDGWQNEYKPTEDGKGWLCGISFKSGDEWITKWDGAECTQIEPLKGGLSGSMKRAGSQLGIGRYLYNLEAYFAICTVIDSRSDSVNNYAKTKDGTEFDWSNPELPTWALPSMQASEYEERMSKASLLVELKDVFREAYLYAKSFNRDDLKDDFKLIYEENKVRIDDEAKENVKNALEAITEWVEQEVKSLPLIAEQSSVELICQSLRDKLVKKSEGQYYDNQPLIDKINEAELLRVSQIKENNGE